MWALFEALNKDPAWATDRGGFMDLYVFAVYTWHKHWAYVLPPQLWVDLQSELQPWDPTTDWDTYEQGTQAVFEECKQENPDFNKDAWPLFDSKMYSHCIGRMFMAAKVLTMLFEPEIIGSWYNHMDEVKEVADEILDTWDFRLWCFIPDADILLPEFYRDPLIVEVLARSLVLRMEELCNAHSETTDDAA